ncbi:hypothetical protein HII36_24350 [Nonomuraea sp. NN258]|uniref:hypothetical protein n=1 Tax=Nonomuraea antri TaxID=2730852 RepID=UPI001569A8E8|nr:hypothetical protein [Nonomuraea antri]NRQ34938.1 hypothetical protein [Nonomuraea antri]
MTLAGEQAPARPAAARPARRWPGWVPVLLLAAGTAGVLLHSGVPGRDLAAFALYVGAGVLLPGTLLWRRLTGGGRTLPEDLAAGLALGYAVEVPVYLAARAAGLPMLVAAWPVAVVAAFAAAPGLRGHWRGRASRERVPPWCSWALCGVVGFLVVWSALSLYRVPVTGAYVDMPYHLALTGEIRHHLPPEVPSVLGERLFYHWFVYADMAATSWVTGVEPVRLVYGLSVLPMMAAMVVLVAVIGRRVSGRWWAGVAAVGVTYFLFSPVLREGVAFTARSLFTAWASPTQTFGALLFAPVVLLLISDGRRGRWVALGVLLVTLTGAKATFLPILLAAALFTFVLRRERVWLIPAAMALVCLLGAQLVLFGRGAQGMAVTPFAAMRVSWGEMAGLSGPEVVAAPLTPLIVLACVHLFCLACVWSGVLGLFGRRPDPGVVFLLGIGLAGIGAMLLLGHPAEAQLYFLEAARPYLSIAAVCGVVAALRHRRVPWAVAGGLTVLGAAVSVAAARLPVPGGALQQVALPYLLPAGLAGLVLTFWRKGLVLGLIGLLTGYALPTSARDVVAQATPRPPAGQLIPAGALEAGRWLRDHSSPDDVVATDLHCRPTGSRNCDSRHFWISGFTERRVLVEGWAYAESTLSRVRLFERSYLAVPFADQARLAANDEVFLRPSAAAVTRLATRYGVRWLFTGVNPALDGYARLRFRNGDSSVYEIAPTRAESVNR